MAWYDRGGKLLGSIGPATTRGVFDPAISPDGKSVAFRRISASGSDLWLSDLTREAEQRLTTDARSVAPVWSPNGDRMVFASGRSGTYNLYQKATSATGKDELLLASSNTKVPTQWSRDGRFIVYTEADPKTKWDVWVLPMGPERKPIPFLHSEFNEYQRSALARQSVDGLHIG
jgi:Tol biopolymer transport system component